MWISEIWRVFFFWFQLLISLFVNALNFSIIIQLIKQVPIICIFYIFWLLASKNFFLLQFCWGISSCAECMGVGAMCGADCRYRQQPHWHWLHWHCRQEAPATGHSITILHTLSHWCNLQHQEQVVSNSLLLLSTQLAGALRRASWRAVPAHYSPSNYLMHLLIPFFILVLVLSCKVVIFVFIWRSFLFNESLISKELNEFLMS